MPIWLRNFTFNQLKEHYDKKKEQEEKINNTITETSAIARPNIGQPTYTTKAPRK